MARAMIVVSALLLTPLAVAADLTGTLTHYAPDGEPAYTEAAQLVLLPGGDWKAVAASGEYACFGGDAAYRPVGAGAYVGMGVDNCALVVDGEQYAASWDVHVADLVIAGVPVTVRPVQITGAFTA